MPRMNIAAPAFEYHDEEPEGYRAGMFRYGRKLGAAATGTTVYEIPPGQSICPYHYEVAEEEWLLVLSGHPTLRTPEGTERLDPWDSVFFPIGPEGAHKVTNETDETVRVLMYSQYAQTSVCVYPDADKIGVWVEGQPEATGDFLRSTRVGYYDGEA